MDINARVLWEDFVINMNDTADWNSDMKEVKVKNKPVSPGHFGAGVERGY